MVSSPAHNPESRPESRPQSRCRLAPVSAAALAALALLALAQPAAGQRAKRVAVVVLDAVAKGPVHETVPVYGRLVSRRTGPVAARVRGAVAEIKVEVGDRVAVGALLARLVGETLDAERALKAAELEEYRARVKTADAQLALARQSLRRIERLRRSAAFSHARFEDKRREVERFRSAAAEVRAKVKQAKAELRMADIALSYTEIRAPYAGVVSKRHTEIGAFLNVGQPVVTLIDDTALEVEAEVPAVRIAGLSAGATVPAAFEDGTGFTAIVRAIVPEENALARTRTVRFAPRFAPRGVGRAVGGAVGGTAAPAVNQSVLLNIPVGAPRTIVSVHKDAVIRRQGGTIVFTVIDGKAALRPVRLGIAIAARFEVLEGLAPGELVVIRGNERLRQGQKVRPRAKSGAS